jgi:hypothetical protein
MPPIRGSIDLGTRVDWLRHRSWRRSRRRRRVSRGRRFDGERRAQPVSRVRRPMTARGAGPESGQTVGGPTSSVPEHPAGHHVLAAGVAAARRPGYVVGLLLLAGWQTRISALGKWTSSAHLRPDDDTGVGNQGASQFLRLVGRWGSLLLATYPAFPWSVDDVIGHMGPCAPPTSPRPVGPFPRQGRPRRTSPGSAVLLPDPTPPRSSAGAPVSLAPAYPHRFVTMRDASGLPGCSRTLVRVPTPYTPTAPAVLA